MNNIIGILKDFVKGNNWVNTIVLIAIFLSLKGELNEIKVVLGIQNEKITQNEKDITENEKRCEKLYTSISTVKLNYATHIGEAYIREDELD